MKRELLIRKKYLMGLLSFTFVALLLMITLPAQVQAADDFKGNTVMKSGKDAMDWLIEKEYILKHTHIPTMKLKNFLQSSYSASSPGPDGLILFSTSNNWSPTRPIHSATIIVQGVVYNLNGYWILDPNRFTIDGKPLIYNVRHTPDSKTFDWRNLHPDRRQERIRNAFTEGNKISCEWREDPNAGWKKIDGTITNRGKDAVEIDWGDNLIWTRTSAQNVATSYNLSGKWRAVNYAPNGTPAHYIINQINDIISWTIQHPDIPLERTRNGKIGGNRISCEFNRPEGPDSNGINRWTPLNGTITERGNQIRWDNGVVWSR